MMKMQMAMADAQAKASRPGDNAMSCDALRVELETMMRDPAVQATAKANGAVAQEKLDELEKGKAEAKGAAAAQMATSLFSGLASAFVPGLGMMTGGAQQAAARAQAAQGQAQAAKNQQDMIAMGDRMIPIMPQIMRGNRLMELAQAKKCDWMQNPQPGK
jgi:hypothetical protein